MYRVDDEGEFFFLGDEFSDEFPDCCSVSVCALWVYVVAQEAVFLAAAALYDVSVVVEGCEI